MFVVFYSFKTFAAAKVLQILHIRKYFGQKKLHLGKGAAIIEIVCVFHGVLFQRLYFFQ